MVNLRIEKQLVPQNAAARVIRSCDTSMVFTAQGECVEIKCFWIAEIFTLYADMQLLTFGM